MVFSNCPCKTLNCLSHIVRSLALYRSSSFNSSGFEKRYKTLNPELFISTAFQLKKLKLEQPKTPKLQQVCWVLTSCNNLLQQADIRMRPHGLRQLATTSLLQVVNRFVASWLFQQACCNSFQQIVTSLQMTSCNKPNFNRLVAIWWNLQACCKLLTSCNKLVKLATYNKSVTFVAVY